MGKQPGKEKAMKPKGEERVMEKYTIVMYNGNQCFLSAKKDAKGAIVDFYEYCGGRVSNDLFEKAVGPMNIHEAIKLLTATCLEPQIEGIYTGCSGITVAV